MDILKTVREIGFFETSCNLVPVLNSKDVQEKAGGVMPLPDSSLKNSLIQIAKWLNNFGKSKYMLLSPEIALIDELAKQDSSKEAILLIPCDMDKESKERLKENLPQKMKVSLFEEPSFLDVFPRNGILIVCGYLAAGRMMVLPETYRLIDHCRDFWGKKVFIPYVELPTAVRYENWLEVEKDKISMVWGADS